MCAYRLPSMVHMILLAVSVSLSNPHKVAAPRREARWRPPRSVLSSDFPMTTPALDSRTPMADIDALIESVDDERARAAAAMEVDEERRSKMATPIQAHARGMLARQHATRQEDSLAQKARRASAGLVDFTRSLYLELTELTDPAPPAVAASPAVPPAAASLTGGAQLLSDLSPTPQQLRTLPLETPSAPATPLARATRPRPRDEASCCSCLTRNGGGGAPLFSGAPLFGGGPQFRLPWASPAFGAGSSAFDTPILDRLLTAHRFRWTTGLDSDSAGYQYKPYGDQVVNNILSPRFFVQSPHGSQASHRSMGSVRSQRSIL